MNIRKRAEPLKTILVIVTGLIIVYISTGLKWIINVALIVAVLSLISNYILQKIDYLWMRLAYLLSFIIPNILLTLVFYAFLTPIAILSKIFGEKNQLDLKNSKKSLFKNYNKKFDPESFEKTW